MGWTFDAAEGFAAHSVCANLCMQLRERGLGMNEIIAAQMVLFKPIGNVVRHARTEGKILVDITQTPPVLHGMDGGRESSVNPKLPTDTLPANGRGLFTSNHLVRELTVGPRTAAKCGHARAMLLGSIAVSA